MVIGGSQVGLGLLGDFPKVNPPNPRVAKMDSVVFSKRFLVFSDFADEMGIILAQASILNVCLNFTSLSLNYFSYL